MVTLEPDSQGQKAICALCEETFTNFRIYTFERHIDRKHKTRMKLLRKLSSNQRMRIVQSFKERRETQKRKMVEATNPDKLRRLAPYKLAYTIGKSHLPISKCSAIVDFARATDPTSHVFQTMTSGRSTITDKILDIHEKVLSYDVKELVKMSPFWSIVIDESVDVTTREQMVVYVRTANQ